MLREAKIPSSSSELQSILARQLIQIKAGEHLPSIRGLARMTGMSIGSISQTLNSLENSGAVQIERRGRLGSLVRHRSIGDLWAYAEREPVVIALTLPSNPLCEGLATALKLLISEAGIGVFLIFIRGSLTRLQVLRENRCHVAVLSEFAAEELCSVGDEVVFKLPPGSWISTHKVYYRPLEPNTRRKLRVAIDRTSFDHERITELEFSGEDVDFQKVSFMQIHRLLIEGSVDAAVFTSDDMDNRLIPEILSRPLSDKVRDLIDIKSTIAAFVIRSENCSIRAVLEEILRADEILDIQRKVVVGEIVAEY